MIRFFNKPEIVDVSVIFEDKSVIPLIEKVDRKSGQISRCSFFPNTCVYGDFKINLRIDWNDLDKFGDPTLDADINKNGKKYSLNKKSWHHTSKINENGIYIYKWKPNIKELDDFTIEINFRLAVTRQAIIMGMARIIKPGE